MGYNTSNLKPLHISMIILVAFVVGQSFVWALPIKTSTEENGRLGRSGIFKAGAPTAINCSNIASASSAVLTDGARYVLQCDDDSYVRWGNTAPTAASGDIILAKWALLDFTASTAGSSLYVACLNINMDSTCRYLEIQ